MTYVGATPTTGDFKILDSITTSSSTTFNLRQGGVAVYPQSANHCLVVLNGVLQTAGSSFNIVNDTIVFASSLASSDVINQILVLGNVNDIGVPSDDTVSTAKLQSSAVTDAKIADVAATKLTGTIATARLGSGTASSSTFLRGDSTFASAGFTAKNFFSAYDPSNNVPNDTDTKIIYETEAFDTASAYDTSNGRFTVPSGEDGKYYLYAKVRHYNDTSMDREVIYLYKNGSTFKRFENRGNNVHNSVQISTVTELAAGDYIEVYYYQNSGSSNNIAIFSAATDQEFLGYRIE